MDYSIRLTRLRTSLASHNCQAYLIEQPINLFYLTGMELSSGKVLVTPKEAFLIVDGRYFETCSKHPLYSVKLLQDHILKNLIKTSRIYQLGFDSHYTTYHAFLSLTQLSQDLAEESHPLEIIPLESIVQNLRLIKDSPEIDLLRDSAKLCHQGYELVASLLREGISELELALELEFFWKRKGANRVAFDSIIAFGQNSSMPHYRAGNTTLKNNTSVLIDIGVVLSQYHSDMTRVVFFGSPPSIMQEIYQIVEEAKAKSLALCRPGTLISELDFAARESISTHGYKEFFTHSTGHGIGLEIHEAPIIRQTGPSCKMKLQAGMVITIEPGIYLPTIGGVRLEDTILITENGYENLTRRV